MNVRTAVAENLLQFHEVPLRVQTSAAEKTPDSRAGDVLKCGCRPLGVAWEIGERMVFIACTTVST